MSLVERYSQFRDRLPPTCKGVTERLRELFAPEEEPPLDRHHLDLTAFHEWIEYPRVDSDRFPEELRKAKSDLGVWVRTCVLRWQWRYQSVEMRSQEREKVAQGILTGGLMTALGAVGLDGAIDKLSEWLITAAAAGARAGFPVPLAHSRARAARNLKVVLEIKASLR